MRRPLGNEVCVIYDTGHTLTSCLSPASLVLFVSATPSAVLYSRTSLPADFSSQLKRWPWVKASIENGWVLSHGCAKALRMGCRERKLCGNEE